ncbi:MAG: YggS family pyridoxal phosphate-dependent enzyme [Azoarcus sp.]|jgi:pyridoxal phosphate enzyme (YggS family)|nr:YggS family pyridoxal phosphate-dependent enzyme [Azoarcus sp.]
MTSIVAALRAVRARIADAAKAAGRDPASVRLLAVSKTCPASAIRAAFEAGQDAFGENYANEMAEKAAELSGLGLEWHFIGPLQSNKTRIVARYCRWAHGIDRLKIAERLASQRDASLPPLQVCLQVNVSGEASKSGVPPDEAVPLARAVAALPRLALRGLMCIPEPTEFTSLLRRRFALLRQLGEQLRAEGHALDTLSMGMSHDLEVAIAEGATIVRVGTAIFGERDKTARTGEQASQ